MFATDIVSGMCLPHISLTVPRGNAVVIMWLHTVKKELIPLDSGTQVKGICARCDRINDVSLQAAGTASHTDWSCIDRDATHVIIMQKYRSICEDKSRYRCGTASSSSLPSPPPLPTPRSHEGFLRVTSLICHISVFGGKI